MVSGKRKNKREIVVKRIDMPLLPCNSLWLIHFNYASVHRSSIHCFVWALPTLLFHLILYVSCVCCYDLSFQTTVFLWRLQYVIAIVVMWCCLLTTLPLRKMIGIHIIPSTPLWWCFPLKKGPGLHVVWTSVKTSTAVWMQKQWDHDIDKWYYIYIFFFW
jgi:hypothetical protein